ncbi:MAG: hypothetical protein R2880_10250 [Deinococcales bacterium]
MIGRKLVSILRELSLEEGLEYQVFSEGWIIRLGQPETGKYRYVYGHTFDLDSAASQLVVSDKVATAILLTMAAIPCVEHKLFLHPQVYEQVAAEGSYKALYDYAVQYDFKVVLKSLRGSSGNDIFRCNNAREIEQAMLKLFQRHDDLAVSPFVEILGEYRLIMLDGQCLLTYLKERPYVIGNGQSPLHQLIKDKFQHQSLKIRQSLIEQNHQQLTTVLPQGQHHLLSWQHNLSKGAEPRAVQNAALADELLKLAQKATQALNIRFASVDVIATREGLKILEINAGMMMEHYIRLVPQGYEQAKQIYKAVLQKLFA